MHQEVCFAEDIEEEFCDLDIIDKMYDAEGGRRDQREQESWDL